MSFFTLVKDQNHYSCFLYSLASVCIVSPILTTIILCVIILIKQFALYVGVIVFFCVCYRQTN